MISFKRIAALYQKKDVLVIQENPNSITQTVLTTIAAVAPVGSVIKLLDELIEKAYNLGASDIHIDPYEKYIRVRLRTDGRLIELREISLTSHAEVVSRVKILAGLRTDEHQTAHEGRFRTTCGNVHIDVRVSVVPTYHGENIVLRLLTDTVEAFTLESLGFSKKNIAKLLNAIHKPYGMVLVTGPTGSGKTTTLYTLVKLLNLPETSIITIEDPIEYAIDGVVQIPANNRTGMDFAGGLRNILRQDPDIIMVGEIRDIETARLAINTSLTGHLLLSTLHTNDAATTLPRLLDLKIENYLIAATVNAVVGQRLVRKICSGCKTTREVRSGELKSLQAVWPEQNFAEPLRLFQGKGCDQCHNSGFKGRIGIQEVLLMNKNIREAILGGCSAEKIRELAKQAGMVPMADDGLQKAKQGLTTIEEVLRTVYE